MSDVAGAPTEQVRRRADTPVFIAALGSSLLALPGLGGFLVIGWMVASALSDPDLGKLAARVVMSMVLLGLPLLGFYLLAGYWRAWLWGEPSQRPRRFWGLSAMYNGLGLLLAALAAVVMVLDRNMGVALVLAVLYTAWTGFMVWMGVMRAQQASTE
ncbi:MAG TPA: hypothetical protein VF594_10455 [Rubricoccaceae bacterium]|jgi:hypothetical protein